MLMMVLIEKMMLWAETNDAARKSSNSRCKTSAKWWKMMQNWLRYDPDFLVQSRMKRGRMAKLVLDNRWSDLDDLGRVEKLWPGSIQRQKTRDRLIGDPETSLLKTKKVSPSQNFISSELLGGIGRMRGRNDAINETNRAQRRPKR